LPAVTLTERADHGGMKAEFLKLPGQSLLVERVAKSSELAFDLRLRRGTAVPNDAGLNPEPTRV